MVYFLSGIVVGDKVPRRETKRESILANSLGIEDRCKAASAFTKGVKGSSVSKELQKALRNTVDPKVGDGCEQYYIGI